MKNSVKKPVKKLIKRQVGGQNPFGTTVNLLRPDDNSIYATTSRAPVQALSAIPGGYVPKTRQQIIKDFENLARTKIYEVPSENKMRIGRMDPDATAKKIIEEYPGSRRKAIELAESVTGLQKGRIKKYNPGDFKTGVKTVGKAIGNVGSAIGSALRGSGAKGSNMCDGDKCGQMKKGGTVMMRSMIPSGGAMSSMKTKKKK